MLTDTLGKGQQTTREVNVSDVLFFPFPGKKKPPEIKHKIQLRGIKNLGSFILFNVLS